MTCNHERSCGEEGATSQSRGPSPFAQAFGRPMEDAVFVGLVTALLSTVVQSLMAHTSNASASHHASLSANSHTATAGLATLARAVDQILGGGNGNGDGGARPLMGGAPSPVDVNTRQNLGAMPTYAQPPVVT